MRVVVVWLDSACSVFPPILPPFSPSPSPVAILTPVCNSSSSSLSSRFSSETGPIGSLLILADGMVVENPEDFYRMQVREIIQPQNAFMKNCRLKKVI